MEDPAEEPRPDPDDDDVGAQPEPGEPETTPLPEPDPDAQEIKRFMVGDGLSSLRVTVSEGRVATNYAPADLIARLQERVAALLRDLGGSLMFYGAAPEHSMTLYFGDAAAPEAQAKLPVELIAPHAERVAHLMELDGDDFFAAALQMGSPARQYAEMTKIVQSEGVTLEWAVRDQTPAVLTSERAHRQHARLTARVETTDHELTVNGTLYRVITESTREGYRGSVGIHLYDWSGRPPGDPKRKRILPLYEKEEVERKIKEGLIGEPIEARLLVRRPVLGTSFEPDSFELVLDDLESGPSADSHKGGSLFEPQGESEDESDS